ncbi:MAG: orotate phosphoribosyltransferase [Candidatus Methylumidiphilus alinenensis]|uniref:Orotate phosphoribosyltransferase n=1 Tax=Candidatus Methylumidiphilus alinenensis TaxID=2202197 RepID=A0A2W4S418_9GAMM|nr:MAG: orotate phosphoribosyltransferase [Candidatus Methylumidiphilus alinenensis]
MYQKNELLRAFIEKNCLLADVDISLSTGTQSSFYFDCKKATFDGEGLSLIVDGVLAIIDGLPEQPTAIGGLTMGADPIVAGVVARAYQLGRSPTHGSIVRKEPKKHGTKSKIENQLPSGTKIVVIDDVITSGGSIKTACKELIAEGYIVVGIIALVDRKAGGKESLEREFGPVHALFDKNDFPALRSLDEIETVAEAA